MPPGFAAAEPSAVLPGPSWRPDAENLAAGHADLAAVAVAVAMVAAECDAAAASAAAGIAATVEKAGWVSAVAEYRYPVAAEVEWTGAEADWTAA